MVSREADIQRMRELVETCEREGRYMTTAEEREYNALEAGLKPVPIADTRGITSVGRSPADESFSLYLRTGEVRTGTGLSTSPNSGQTGSDNADFTIPEGFWQNLQVALKAYGGLSNDFRLVETDTGNPMPWPTISPISVVASLVSSENTSASPVNPYVFGEGLLQSWTIAEGPVLASLQLIEDSAFDVDEFIAARFGEAFGRAIAAFSVSGTGTNQPLGIIPALNTMGAWTAGNSGGFINLTAATSVQVLGGTSASPATVTELAGNVLAPQTLLGMIQAVDPAYRNAPDGTPTAKFYVNDAQLKGLREVVDFFGHPLLQQPNTGGAPMLWGYPVVVDPNIQNLTASTVGGPVFGNMEHAMVMRQVRSGARILRLVERYADSLAVGYYGYFRLDMRSNDVRAAVTVKPAGT